MSAPMRRIIARLRARGVEVYEMPGWEARCRCHNGSHETDPRKVRAWTTDRLGFTVHITTSPRHTGNKAIAYTANILIGGNGSVPGPLCQWGIDGDGRVIVVAAGRSNHVGQIGTQAVSMTKAGTFSLSSKYDNRGQGAAVDGNTVLDGVEILSSPGPSEKQRAATVALAAEWCREYGKPATVVHGHGEVATSRGYSDPGMHMGEFRSAVASDLRAISSGSTIPLGDTPTGPTSGTPTPAPNPKEFPDMDATEFKKLFKAAFKESLRDPEIAGDVARAALGGTYGIDASGDGKPDTAGNLIASIYTKVAAINSNIAPKEAAK